VVVLFLFTSGLVLIFHCFASSVLIIGGDRKHACLCVRFSFFFFVVVKISGVN